MRTNLLIFLSMVVLTAGITLYVKFTPQIVDYSDEFPPDTHYGVPYPDTDKGVDRYDFQNGTWLYRDTTAAYMPINPNYVHPYYQEQDAKRIKEQEIEDWIRDNEDDVRQILEDQY